MDCTANGSIDHSVASIGKLFMDVLWNCSIALFLKWTARRMAKLTILLPALENFLWTCSGIVAVRPDSKRAKWCWKRRGPLRMLEARSQVVLETKGPPEDAGSEEPSGAGNEGAP
ncbi:hypothetical protein ONE63_009905 [Megalurothrips usitatus]|uniref:Uncharacterized protein n=1 Tax=Megalurothrips usitatus TaxID=439358 RepID=A0AAV7XG54_9NEOP|nr:hypothetical protein ONE63_009905 [Megalurothrips usitatus]